VTRTLTKKNMPFLSQLEFLLSELDMSWLVWKASAQGSFSVWDLWSSAPVACPPIRPKSKFFNIWQSGYSLSIKIFMVIVEKPKNPDFETFRSFSPRSYIICPKSRNAIVRHDGILSIKNLKLVMKNHPSIFQLTGDWWLVTGDWWPIKEFAPYFRGNMKFLNYPAQIIVKCRSCTFLMF
jgi:hypothetical protein